jgi:hypothetical protein
MFNNLFRIAKAKFSNSIPVSPTKIMFCEKFFHTKEPHEYLI